VKALQDTTFARAHRRGEETPARLDSSENANTDMDFFVRRTLAVAFFDVADGDTLLTAIRQPAL
jgi:hypothetical protein